MTPDNKQQRLDAEIKRALKGIEMPFEQDDWLLMEKELDKRVPSPPLSYITNHHIYRLLAAAMIATVCLYGIQGMVQSYVPMFFPETTLTKQLSKNVPLIASQNTGQDVEKVKAVLDREVNQAKKVEIQKTAQPITVQDNASPRLNSVQSVNKKHSTANLNRQAIYNQTKNTITKTEPTIVQVKPQGITPNLSITQQNHSELKQPITLPQTTYVDRPKIPTPQPPIVPRMATQTVAKKIRKTVVREEKAVEKPHHYPIVEAITPILVKTIPDKKPIVNNVKKALEPINQIGTTSNFTVDPTKTVLAGTASHKQWSLSPNLTSKQVVAIASSVPDRLRVMAPIKRDRLPVRLLKTKGEVEKIAPISNNMSIKQSATLASLPKQKGKLRTLPPKILPPTDFPFTPPKPDQWQIGLHGVTDARSATNKGTSAIDVAAGFSITRKFNQRWAIETGTFFGRKQFQAKNTLTKESIVNNLPETVIGMNGSEGNPEPNTSFQHIEKVATELDLLEIPILAKYSFPEKEDLQPYIAFGPSLYLPIREKQIYHHNMERVTHYEGEGLSSEGFSQDPVSTDAIGYGVTASSQYTNEYIAPQLTNKLFWDVLNLRAGFKFHLNERLQVQAEGQFKTSLQKHRLVPENHSVLIERKRLTSVGFQIGVAYSL